MDHVDTMIVSYAWKGISGYGIERKTVSSIAAQEFLLMHTEDLEKPRYYLPRLHRSGVEQLFTLIRAGNKDLLERQMKPHPGWRKRTDRLVIDFGTDYPRIFEFGHNRLAGAINGGEIRYYENCIRGLDRRLRRDLLARFEFMVGNRVKCAALTVGIVERMFVLLAAFLRTGNPKANFRNTINDMLILAAALEGRTRLFSRDTTLNRFAANFYEVSIEKAGGGALCIDFGEGASDRRAPFESKGYINRSWRVIERRA